ncbi:MAG: hypothetical protein KIS73_17050 [Enhydrobacter sp.]|nr:hypothetical protein [Enhydrobacter sp.]
MLICNLYTYEITPEIIRDYERDFTLVALDFPELMRGTNQPAKSSTRKGGSRPR